MLTIKQVNDMATAELTELLGQCCAAQNWVNRLAEARPFTSLEDMQTEAAAIWQNLNSDDYLEAFSAHPMIGDLTSLQKKFANTASTAASEQAATTEADDATLQKLHQLNHEYKDKHGFIFIIFASGKSANEMLTALESRLNNDSATEIANAAAEQLNITQLRIRKLFSMESL
ncbi:MAG: 2-oxo-4-hydroxy-4-carboxy-5-ureidoimidazoline decarboxylase [Aestuariibacter sp.]